MAREALFVFGEKNLTGGNFLLSGEFEQLPAELAGKQNRPDLAFEGDVRPPALRGLYGDIPHLGDADAGGADGLQQERQPSRRRRPQPLKLAACQITGSVSEGTALKLEEFHPAVLPPQEAEQAVDGGNFPVDGGRQKALGQKINLPFGSQLLCDKPAVQPGDEGADIPQIFFKSGRSPFLLAEKFCVSGDVGL